MVWSRGGGSVHCYYSISKWGLFVHGVLTLPRVFFMCLLPLFCWCVCEAGARGPGGAHGQGSRNTVSKYSSLTYFGTHGSRDTPHRQQELRSLTRVRCSRPTPLVAGRALLGFALRDSAGGAQGRGGAHEGRHARAWGHPNPWRQRLRATPSSDELSRPSSL